MSAGNQSRKRSRAPAPAKRASPGSRPERKLLATYFLSRQPRGLPDPDPDEDYGLEAERELDFEKKRA